MDTLQTLLKDNCKLPSPPAIAVRILEEVKKDDFSFHDLARIISSDPALTARILSVANSSYYSLPSKVTTIEKALTVLGVVPLKNLALSFVISKDLKGESAGGFDFDLFWRRAITAAVGAELTTTLIRERNSDAFVSALLQDIGVIILYFCRTSDYLKVLDEKRANGLSIEEAERRIFGFDHQELGFEILKKWGLPEEIYLPIRYHHQTQEAPEAWRIRATVLALSDRIAGVYHGMRSVGMVQEIKDLLGVGFNIAGSDIERMIDEVAERSMEIFSSFEIDPGDMKPYSIILQEANEELSRLNLSYEQLVMEYKQAKEKAEKLALELKEANDRLRELVFRDGLTGLYNHRYFQELMDTELSRAMRYNHSFSLIMFDIDHFKKINDTYGHPRGDVVLKAIGATVERLIRSCDYAARYGGEEFAVVLPETELKGASILAERLRVAIEQMEIDADGRIIRSTISIGVATYAPDSTVKEKARIIAAADKALYTSKHDGRNRITLAKSL